MSDQRRGLLYGTAAYLWWGMFPLYFALLAPATPLDILANRIVWTALVVIVILAVRRRWAWLRDLSRDRRSFFLLLVVLGRQVGDRRLIGGLPPCAV